MNCVTYGGYDFCLLNDFKYLDEIAVLVCADSSLDGRDRGVCAPTLQLG